MTTADIRSPQCRCGHHWTQHPTSCAVCDCSVFIPQRKHTATDDLVAAYIAAAYIDKSKSWPNAEYDAVETRLIRWHKHRQNILIALTIITAAAIAAYLIATAGTL